MSTLKLTDIEITALGEEHPKYKTKRLPLEKINVVTQIRQTFDPDSIALLAQDIALNGIIQPSTVMCFDSERAKEYLKLINLIHNKRHSFKSLKPSKLKGKTVYYILVAGERRFRALKLLHSFGCSKCRARMPRKAAEEHACWEKHFKRNSFTHDFRVAENVSPVKSLFIQFSENTYDPPSAHQEAKVYAPYYRLMKILNNGKMTIARFSQQVGRSPQKMSTAIRYCGLPAKYQNFVEAGTISYGVANQLARLYENGVKGEELDIWLIKAVAGHYNVKKFTPLVSQKIDEIRSGAHQLDLGLLMQEQSIINSRPSVKRIVDPGITKAMMLGSKYYEKLAHLMQTGILKPTDEIFASETAEENILVHLTATQQLTGALSGRPTHNGTRRKIKRRVVNIKKNTGNAIEES